ncbi:uncharacterized protein LOC131690695 isoform X1 [Topomyia yanbarensis]|uniref:uncharacterized protein LOC131690695 isoform X1 n=1 Tax=Topomyia yanbarensis TaxID=2498891 RepID=UPI00273BEF86|nr:uncharacterized protein LOC131690695 isoform X1 [Topomyia yanbarensis]
MSGQPMGDGKRFLEGLILRAEDVLAKMIYKLHRTNVPLEEMVPWINSVYGFVNSWEESLKDVSIDALKRAAAAAAAASPGSGNKSEEALMEEINNYGSSSKQTTGEDAWEARSQQAGKSKRNPVRTEEAEPVFEYVEQSLKDYKINRTGRCVISHVGTSARSFCIVDRDHHDCTKLFAAMQNSRGCKYAELPAPGKVFGVYLDASLFRAVRNKPIENSTLKLTYIRLLDTGEVLPYDDSMVLCALSDYFQKLPAFAIRCILVNILDDPFCDDLEQFLKKSLHTTQYYKVVSVEGHVLFLKLSQQPIPVPDKMTATNSSAESTPTKPRRRRSRKSKHIPTRINIFKPEPVETSNAISIRMPGTTIPLEEKPTRSLFEPIDLKGVQSERESIPGTGSTSSPGSSTEEPYRYFRNDSFEHIEDDVQQPIVPPIGCQVYLIPKFIKDVEHFWCHVVSPDFVDASLLEMEMKLNSPERSVHYRKLHSPPAFGQRVFAKYSDKRWYRAEVAQYFDENNVLVFYVDYGNAEMVLQENIRLWDEQFSYLPYQAVLCRLAHVRRAKPYHKQAVVEMNRNLLNQRVLATIVNNGTPWEVTIQDKDGFDFSVALLLAGLAKKLEVKSSSDSSSGDEDIVYQEDDDEMCQPVIGA